MMPWLKTDARDLERRVGGESMVPIYFILVLTGVVPCLGGGGGGGRGGGGGEGEGGEGEGGGGSGSGEGSGSSGKGGGSSSVNGVSTSVPVKSASGSISNARSYGSGSTTVITIPSGQLFSGRLSGGGTRNNVFGSRFVPFASSAAH